MDARRLAFLGRSPLPALPGVEQRIDMPALLRGERDAFEEAPRFTRIVVRDRSLEVLPNRKRLA